MISEIIIRRISRHAVSAGFAIAIAAGFAYAQETEPTGIPQKDPATVSAAVQKESSELNVEVKDELLPAAGHVAVNSSDGAPRPNVFSSSVKTIQPRTNPFSRDLPEKNAAAPRAQATSSGWQFAFAPYLYMTGMTGTIGARGRVAEIDLDFADVFEHLNLGLMGAFEARKGRFIMTSDLIWIKLGEERETPGDLFSSTKLGVNMFVFDPEVGYRLYEGEGGSFDVLGGIRVMSVETNLNFRAGILPAVDASERKTWATPVIGAHGTLNLTPKFFLATKFDIGGGIGADFTGQFYGGAGYRIKPNIALIGGYRYVKTDYDSEAGFIFDTTMSGILLGAKFSF